MKEELKSVTNRTKKDNKEIHISVEEIENGYLIIKNIEWRDAKKGYHYETKKYFSKVNPLTKAEPPLSEAFKA